MSKVVIAAKATVVTRGLFQLKELKGRNWSMLSFRSVIVGQKYIPEGDKKQRSFQKREVILNFGGENPQVTDKNLRALVTMINKRGKHNWTVYTVEFTFCGPDNKYMKMGFMMSKDQVTVLAAN